VQERAPTRHARTRARVVGATGKATRTITTTAARVGGLTRSSVTPDAEPRTRGATGKGLHGCATKGTHLGRGDVGELGLAARLPLGVGVCAGKERKDGVGEWE
jgi:hypothetical protein